MLGTLPDAAAEPHGGPRARYVCLVPRRALRRYVPCGASSVINLSHQNGTADPPSIQTLSRGRTTERARGRQATAACRTVNATFVLTRQTKNTQNTQLTIDHNCLDGCACTVDLGHSVGDMTASAPVSGLTHILRVCPTAEREKERARKRQSHTHIHTASQFHSERPSQVIFRLSICAED